MDNHKHKWKLSHTAWEYPVGFNGTGGAEEYAYLLCECPAVKKIKVEQPGEQGVSSD